MIAITDDVKDISPEPDRHDRTLSRKIFIADLGSKNFRIGVYTYKTPGSVCSWVDILKIPVVMDKSHPSVVSNIASVEKDSPIFLSIQDTMCAIALMRKTTGMNKRYVSSLLVSNFLKFAYPYLCFNIPEQHIVDEITAIILCGNVIDSEDDTKVVSYTHVLNSCGNREG